MQDRRDVDQLEMCIRDRQFGVTYLFSDFKKKNGYKRSCELSVQYELYRQDYCGCRFSQMEREKKKITEELSTDI